MTSAGIHDGDVLLVVACPGMGSYAQDAWTRKVVAVVEDGRLIAM